MFLCRVSSKTTIVGQMWSRVKQKRLKTNQICEIMYYRSYQGTSHSYFSDSMSNVVIISSQETSLKILIKPLSFYLFCDNKQSLRTFQPLFFSNPTLTSKTTLDLTSGLSYRPLTLRITTKDFKRPSSSLFTSSTSNSPFLKFSFENSLYIL